MNYRRNEKNRNSIKFILLAAFIVAVFFSQGFIFRHFSLNIPAKAAGAVKAGEAAKEEMAASFLAVFSSKYSLVKENESLKASMSEAKARILLYDNLIKENDELKAMLGRADKNKTVLAVITGKPGNSPYDTLILDVGKNNGVKIGADVIAYGSVAIGEINEVSENSSRAELFSSYGREYGATILSNSTPIKLFGRGGGNFAGNLPRGVTVKEGDQAVSAGLSRRILGVAESVSSDPREPYQQIIFRSPVNANELRFVEVSI